MGKITIQLNGKETVVAKGNISDLLKNHKLNPTMVIVEINGTIISKTSYQKTTLNENDTVEIIRYIGGGKK